MKMSFLTYYWLCVYYLTHFKWNSYSSYFKNISMESFMCSIFRFIKSFHLNWIWCHNFFWFNTTFIFLHSYFHLLLQYTRHLSSIIVTKRKNQIFPAGLVRHEISKVALFFAVIIRNCVFWEDKKILI